LLLHAHEEFAQMSSPPIPEETAPEPVMVSAADAARLLGLSRSQVYALLDRGALESRYVGARRLIPMASLRAFVDRLPTQRPARAG
jgi:excisionase family DNA binding protein